MQLVHSRLHILSKECFNCHQLFGIGTPSCLARRALQLFGIFMLRWPSIEEIALELVHQIKETIDLLRLCRAPSVKPAHVKENKARLLTSDY